ncbi:MAG: SAM-dependent chlorinase/fluorinase [Desulforhopalus sp.]
MTDQPIESTHAEQASNPLHPMTLITDFGLTDEYVGVIKGVILSYNPGIHIIDISHQIPPQNIQTASHLLARSYSYFPPCTVHLAIVDPGVGSDRSILAIKKDSHYFVGPDNGIFTPIIKSAGVLSIYRVTESNLFLSKVSNTFHGRDIMAPVAARLASGFDIENVGPRINAGDCFLSESASCSISDDVLHGEVTHVDTFGNVCTNISRSDVERFSKGRKVIIKTSAPLEETVETFCSSYTGQAENALLALYDSHDFLEIAENKGNASQRLKLSAGSKVSLCVETPSPGMEKKHGQV